MPTAPSSRDSLDPAAGRFLETGPKKLLIDGKWVAAQSGETFDTVDPATESVLGQAAAAGSNDVDAAVNAARNALEKPNWANMPPHDRTKTLLRIARIMDENAEELAQLETLDVGLPITVTRNLTSRLGTVFEYYAGWCTKIYGETNPSSSDFFNFTLREPIGVCGQIIPWNGPAMSAAWKIAPALACGNTVILKPAEQTPLTCIRLGELLLEADIPDGVVNILTGFGRPAGEAIAQHPGIDKVAFTGSTAVGKRILEGSAKDLKRITLELGGKSPNIIFDDADLDLAVAGAVRAFCSNSGQVCVAGSRLFVQRGIHDEFVEKLTRAVAANRVGDPFLEDTNMGPLVSHAQFSRVNGYIDIGRDDDGATVSAGGTPHEGKGFYVHPTIFTNVNNNMQIAREEIFGPVVAVIPFDDEDDVLRQGNDTDFGLASAVWTRDMARAHRVTRKLKAGNVWVNTYFMIDPIAPFGGYKQSGLGRELGRQSIDSYTQTKTVWINTAT